MWVILIRHILKEVIMKEKKIGYPNKMIGKYINKNKQDEEEFKI